VLIDLILGAFSVSDLSIYFLFLATTFCLYNISAHIIVLILSVLRHFDGPVVPYHDTECIGGDYWDGHDVVQRV
jgi:hypothetical protein